MGSPCAATIWMLKPGFSTTSTQGSTTTPSLKRFLCLVACCCFVLELHACVVPQYLDMRTKCYYVYDPACRAYAMVVPAPPDGDPPEIDTVALSLAVQQRYQANVVIHQQMSAHVPAPVRKVRPKQMQRFLGFVHMCIAFPAAPACRKKSQLMLRPSSSTIKQTLSSVMLPKLRRLHLLPLLQTLHRWQPRQNQYPSHAMCGYHAKSDSAVRVLS
jgi:hypothetical protein